jgi:uncharacterized protein (DUF2236 family)
MELPRSANDLRTMIQASLQNALIGEETAPLDLSRPRPDEGLFGPDSVTWRVHQDASMLIGGIRALLLQTMHPLAMAGVAQHSSYESDPFGRLRRTSRYVGDVSFAPTDEALAAIAMVKRVHRSVRGTAPDGREYYANDPHLLAWVHHALLDSFLRAYQTYGPAPLTAAEADQYVLEQSKLADLIGGVSPEPARSVAELKRWLVAIRPEMKATREARDAAFFLLTVPMAPPMAAAYAVLLSAAISSLPRFVRRGLWLPTSQIATKVLIEPSAKAMTRTLSWAMAAPLSKGSLKPTRRRG